MRGRGFILALLAGALSLGASAAWYWPFGSERQPEATIPDAENTLGDGKVDLARTLYGTVLTNLTVAPPSDMDGPAVSNMLAFVRRRIGEIDEERRQTPPLEVALEPLTAAIAAADAKFKDGESREAEDLYRDALTNTVRCIETQYCARVGMPVFGQVLNAKRGHVNGRLQELRGKKRMSELLEPASLLLDEASDLMADGKSDEAVEKYREAIRKLEEIENENSERAATPEFQTVRNKRAYADAQLNAILLEEARMNAKAVAVTNTTNLEQKIAAMRRQGTAPADRGARPELESQLDAYMKDARARDRELGRAASSARFERESEERIRALFAKDPASRRGWLLLAGLELYRENYGEARKDVNLLLAKNPGDVSALNLLAAVEAAERNYGAAEEALAKAIRLNPKDHHAYYNLANLLIKRGGDRNLARARRFYEKGLKAGGSEDARLERILR